MTQLTTIAALLLAFVANASTKITVSQANDFFDTLLGTHLLPLLQRNPYLYPATPIGDFTFVVPRIGFNGKLYANITGGALKGWHKEIRRLGNCAPSQSDHEWRFGCELDFSGINANLIAHTRGESIFDRQNTFDVNVEVEEAVGSVGVTSFDGETGALRSFAVHHVNLKTTYDSDKRQLNNEQSLIFKERIQGHVKRALYGVLYAPFKDILARAISLTDFPHSWHGNPYAHF